MSQSTYAMHGRHPIKGRSSRDVAWNLYLVQEFMLFAMIGEIRTSPNIGTQQPLSLYLIFPRDFT